MLHIYTPNRSGPGRHPTADIPPLKCGTGGNRSRKPALSIKQSHFGIGSHIYYQSTWNGLFEPVKYRKEVSPHISAHQREKIQGDVELIQAQTGGGAGSGSIRGT
jgi:hypothetical protein